MTLSLFLTVLRLFFLSSVTAGDEYPSSCKGLSNGEHLIKMLDGDDYPVVKVKCSNDYIILDYNLDKNIKSYFNSFVQWHTHVAGPDNINVVHWEDWFIPTSDSRTISARSSLHKFLLSPNCNECDESKAYNIYDTKTTYWMSGNIFGCFWKVKGHVTCDVNQTTYDCYSCSSDITKDINNIRIEINARTLGGLVNEYGLDAVQHKVLQFTGICPVNIGYSYDIVPDSHDDCIRPSFGYKKPSIGINSRHCVCVNHNKAQVTYEGTYTKDKEKKDKNTGTQETITVDGITYDFYKLKLDDFLYGTYRIKKSGYYKITENIEFNFNPGSSNDPQEEYKWMPSPSQADQYPGAGDYRDIYFLGFFAGISIETDDTILDLGGHKLSMAKEFYYQQRWFTNIEIGNQYFPPGEGPGFFGPSPLHPKNIVIKNGIVGLSSHHGIHGSENENVYIYNMKVINFETHGIHMNQFNNIKLENIDIGPNTQVAYLSGEYGHWRYILPRIKRIAEETEGQTVQFYGRDEGISMQEVADEIERLMNIAWDYVVNGIKFNSDNKDWILAKDLFINDNGLSYAGSTYGILLNTFAGGTFNVEEYYCHDAQLNNIKIHDLRHKMKEYVRMYRKPGGIIFKNSFNGVLNGKYMVDDINNLDVEDVKNGLAPYKGNVLTDALIMMNLLSDNWNYLGFQLIMNDAIGDWAVNNNASGLENLCLGCNGDVMDHSGRGVFGIRIDRAYNIKMTNIDIYNLYSFSDIGTYACRNYSHYDNTADYSGHFVSNIPMQIGWSGNMNHGISVACANDIELGNVTIDNLVSHTGDVFGIAIYPNIERTIISDDISIKNLHAGKSVTKNTFNYNDRPNTAPAACAFLAYGKFLNNGVKVYRSNVTALPNVQISQCNLMGHVGCMGLTQNRQEFIGIPMVNHKKSELFGDHTSGIFNTPHYYTMAGTYSKTCSEESTADDKIIRLINSNDNILKFHNLEKYYTSLTTKKSKLNDNLSKINKQKQSPLKNGNNYPFKTVFGILTVITIVVIILVYYLVKQLNNENEKSNTILDNKIYTKLTDVDEENSSFGYGSIHI